MKKHLASFWFTLSLACTLWTMPAVLTGCSTSAQTTTYKAATTTAVTVDAAMTAWGDYVALNHPPVAQEQAVKSAYQKYQAAAILALDAYQAALSGVSTNSATYTSASATAAQALADLVSVIQSFGITFQ